MTAVTNNRRRPWPRLPMTADAHDRGQPKKNKKKKRKKKKKKKKKKKRKKKKKKKRTAVMTAVTNNRRRPWPRSPMTADAHDRGHPEKKNKKKK